MIENPEETKEDIEMTRRLMLNLALDDILLEYFTPYPGTEAYKKAREYGYFNPAWDNLTTFAVSFIPRGLTEEYLEKQFKSLYKAFYFRPRIALNYLRRLGSTGGIFSLPSRFLRLLFSN